MLRRYLNFFPPPQALLVAVLILFASLASPLPLAAQVHSDATFFVEEAFRADARLLQHHIAVEDGDASYTFVHEWASPECRHHLAWALPLSASEEIVGDVSFDYRYQLLDDGRVAAAPRLTIAAPAGELVSGGDLESLTLALNVPFTVVHGDRFATHWNAGATRIIAIRRDGDSSTTWSASAAAVWSVSEKAALVVEALFERNEWHAAIDPTESGEVLVISLGARRRFDFGSDVSIFPGIAVPFTIEGDDRSIGFLLHLRFDHEWGR